MAAFTVGSAIEAGTNCQTRDGLAGGAIGACDAVVLDETQSPQRWELADADNASDADGLYGIALNAATAEDEHLRVAVGGEVIMSGASGTVAVAAYVGPTAGDLVPIADVMSADYPVYLGMWRTATIFSIHPHTTGVALG